MMSLYEIRERLGRVELRWAFEGLKVARSQADSRAVDLVSIL